MIARMLLIDVDGVSRGLARLRERGVVPRVPNEWQVALGVLRMWQRMLFRSDTVGTSSAPVRKTWRARALAFRPLRFPFLVAERAIAPLDFSGLLSSRERVIKHLLAAHHDQNQFAYDLEMLRAEPGALKELLERVRAVIAEDSGRTRWLRDLCVFEGYHEALALAAERALEGDLGLTEAEQCDPDTSFLGYLAWCAMQPASLEETMRAIARGRYSIASGLAAEGAT